MEPGSLRRYKVAFVGEARVGKTSLICALFGNQFREDQPSSIAPDPFFGTFRGADGTPVQLHVWDTVGQDTVLETSTAYIRGSALVLVAFNLCDISTLMACSEWAHEVRNRLGDEPQLMLVGTQQDREADRRVSPQLAHDKAAEIGALFVETSAKTGHQVDTLKGLMVQLCTASSLELRPPQNTVKLACPSSSPSSHHHHQQQQQGACGC